MARGRRAGEGAVARVGGRGDVVETVQERRGFGQDGARACGVVEGGNIRPYSRESRNGDASAARSRRNAAGVCRWGELIGGRRRSSRPFAGVFEGAKLGAGAANGEDVAGHQFDILGGGANI
jgi:hypothetical protein